MPVASLRREDLGNLVSMVFCFARLDAPLLAVHGGRPVTELPPHLAPDFDKVVHSWQELLAASGTASRRELAVWLNQLTGSDCWIDCDDESVIVVTGTTGTGLAYPFALRELQELAAESADNDDE